VRARTFAGINTAQRARHPAARRTRAPFSAANEPLAIWGWRASLYVETGRRQATRQAHTEAQLNAGRGSAIFWQRYSRIFRRRIHRSLPMRRAGNFAFEDRARAHEAFPPLRAWVQSHYTQIARRRMAEVSLWKRAHPAGRFLYGLVRTEKHQAAQPGANEPIVRETTRAVDVGDLSIVRLHPGAQRRERFVGARPIFERKISRPDCIGKGPVDSPPENPRNNVQK